MLWARLWVVHATKSDLSVIEPKSPGSRLGGSSINGNIAHAMKANDEAAR